MIRIRSVEMLLDFVAFKLFPNTGIPFLERRGTGNSERDWDHRASLNPLIAATAFASESEAIASATAGLRSTILPNSDVDPAWKILEIGCGIGNILRSLAPLAGEVHGVDISSQMLKEARERLADTPNVFLHKTDGLLNMFPDNYFDLVFSSGVFIHFPTKEAVYTYFGEVVRVLKPDKTFRFHVDGRNYLRWRRDSAGTLRGVVFSPEEVRENLGKYGFKLRDMTGENSINMWFTAVLHKD